MDQVLVSTPIPIAISPSSQTSSHTNSHLSFSPPTLNGISNTIHAPSNNNNNNNHSEQRSPQSFVPILNGVSSHHNVNGSVPSHPVSNGDHDGSSPKRESLSVSDASVGASIGERDYVVNSNSPNGSHSGADSDDTPKKTGRRKINIEFIEDKSRRHITFSKRKAGIMKKAYELSTLTGTQVLLLVASETGHVYTFATPKLQPLITKTEGKNLIQACLNAPDPMPYPALPDSKSWNRQNMEHYAIEAAPNNRQQNQPNQQNQQQQQQQQQQHEEDEKGSHKSEGPSTPTTPTSSSGTQNANGYMNSYPVTIPMPNGYPMPMGRNGFSNVSQNQAQYAAVATGYGMPPYGYGWVTSNTGGVQLSSSQTGLCKQGPADQDSERHN